MGHRIKGQTPRRYRPSVGRRSPGVTPIAEGDEKFALIWNRLVNHLAKTSKSPSPVKKVKTPPVRKGRFLMY
jgi:hypothetical protein